MREQVMHPSLLPALRRAQNAGDQLAGAAADAIVGILDALKGLSDLYALTWDRVDGALVMMPENIGRFENAHSRARIALGEPLVGDDELEPEEPLIPQPDITT